jgi:hypothetical protein
MIGTTTTLNVIQGALRRINSYQSGETIATPDAQDCLDTFNDLLDSLSLDKEIVFGSNENILYWTAGQKLYKIGNPVCTLLGYQPFTGTVTSGSPTITGVTNMPANLVAGQNAAYTVGSGSILTDSDGLIPANTTVLSFNSVAQTVTMSANATGSSSGLDTITYTVPGDFPINRPLRITHGFTRFNALDFTLDVYANETKYTEILYKAQPGPWPIIGWYNNTFPYGLLNVYQTPGNGAELHLFTDTILSNLTLNQIIVMPQGYNRMLKWILAKELCAEFGFPLSEAIKTNAAESLALIKALNAKPAATAKYDRELTRGNRADAGWVMNGGYR